MNKDLCVQTRKAEHHKCWRESNRYRIGASTKFMLPSTIIPCRNVCLHFAVMKILWMAFGKGNLCSHYHTNGRLGIILATLATCLYTGCVKHKMLFNLFWTGWLFHKNHKTKDLNAATTVSIYSNILSRVALYAMYVLYSAPSSGGLRYIMNKLSASIIQIIWCWLCCEAWLDTSVWCHNNVTSLTIANLMTSFSALNHFRRQGETCSDMLH